MSFFSRVKEWFEKEFSTPFESQPTSVQGLVAHLELEFDALNKRVEALESANTFTPPIGISQPIAAPIAEPVVPPATETASPKSDEAADVQ